MPASDESSRSHVAWAGIPALASMAAVYALRRRLRPGLLGKGVQDTIRNHGVFRNVLNTEKRRSSDVWQRAKDYFRYGTAQVHSPKTRDAYGNAPAPSKYRKAFDALPIEKDISKLEEARTWNHAAPGFMPAGSEVSMARTRMPKSDEAMLRLLHKRLSGAAGGSEFIVKGPHGFQSGTGLLTDKNLPEALKKYRAMEASGSISHGGKSYNLHELRMLRRENPEAYAKFLRDSGHLKALDLKDLVDGYSMLAQRRLPVDPLAEARVHVVGGKVVPGLSQWRDVQRGGQGMTKQLLAQLQAVAGVRPRGLSDAEKFVQQHLDKIPAETRSELAKSLALDVARLQGRKGFSVMETNPSSFSGFLNNGNASVIPNHQLVSQLQGRDTHLLAGLRAILAGGAAGGAGLAASAVVPQQKRPWWQA